MPTRAAVACLALSLLAVSGALRAAAAIPEWAYAIPPAPPAGAAPPPAASADTSSKQVPGSTLTFTRQQISDGFGPADWFPGDHPAMPEIVAHGKRPDVRACGLCHYPNGKGRQENAGISGLPVSYFIQTMNDFKNGLRKSAEPRKANTNLMIAYAKAMTPEEIKETAEYFGAMAWTPWVRVVETSTVPKVVSRGGIWIPVEGAEKEPIGVRIVETPEYPERTEILRDPRAGFIAYVPVGSVKKGEALAKTGGGGRTEACGVCHGADLRGLGPVPGIAGRSPSYLTRQMYDMQAGARRGEWVELMKRVVANLSNEDLVNISAYVASLSPAAAASAPRQAAAAPGGDMYGLIGKMLTAPGKRDEFIGLLTGAVGRMPGNLSYIVAKDTTDENALWITEVWDSKASHEASLSLPSVKEAIAKGRPMIAGFGERYVTTPIGGYGLMP